MRNQMSSSQNFKLTERQKRCCEQPWAAVVPPRWARPGLMPPLPPTHAGDAGQRRSALSQGSHPRCKAWTSAHRTSPQPRQLFPPPLTRSPRASADATRPESRFLRSGYERSAPSSRWWTTSRSRATKAAPPRRCALRASPRPSSRSRRRPPTVAGSRATSTRCAALPARAAVRCRALQGGRVHYCVVSASHLSLLSLRWPCNALAAAATEFGPSLGA